MLRPNVATVNILRHLQSGLSHCLRNLKLWGLLYLTNVLFAALVIVPLLYYVGDKLAYSMATDRLLDGFDYTLFFDFLNQYKEFPTLFASQTMVVGLLFMVVNVFLTGGILHRFRQPVYQKSLTDFWQGCGHYFWRLLRLTLYFGAVHLLVAFLFLTIFNLSVKGGLDRFDSEASIYNRAMICFGVYVVVALFFFMVQDYAKALAVRRKKKLVFKDFWGSFGFCIQHFLNTYLPYFVIFLIFCADTFIYSKFDAAMEHSGRFSWGLFLLGQLFIILQIGFKLWNLGTVSTIVDELSEKPATD